MEENSGGVSGRGDGRRIKALLQKRLHRKQDRQKME